MINRNLTLEEEREEKEENKKTKKGKMKIKERIKKILVWPFVVIDKVMSLGIKEEV